MPAVPSDIALYTTPGVLLISPANKATSDQIAQLHVDARDLLDDEIEMFYVNPDDAQVVLDQIWSMQMSSAPTYIAAEVAETLGLGTTIPIAPKVPSIDVFESASEVGEALRVRAYAAELGSDRYVVELLGE